ncbi:30S ribosomal protein S4 [Candidatus Amesbacteria bacterium RIFOXYB1_FULL_44_23]|uniref:Small ribosomal subunit protein uS4 n=1 Tax=Candidatus Amesbacteria bacterium RIFOXYB1_FULL_44_23 TaxID=1797263 RepID=A0A1F4ZV28_9BACT|nr:MAG: 30S ribosomal protein S4 [Candidatus Amesbacteria bacterium RIFOXYB1_FULL_44_23]
MSHYTGPKNRLSRRENFDLFGKGNKLRRAQNPPGQHGPKGSRRPSDFGAQLREKQKTKRIYGIIERQFRGYFEKAKKVRGKTGEYLLRLLETRLDNVVYRLGFVPTRAMARQLVSHGHVLINDGVVSIPSYQIGIGETVALDATAANIPQVKACLENPKLLPAWLQKTGSKGKIISFPLREHVDSPINEQLIVEFYSR